MSAFMEALTKGVETAMKNIFTSGQFSPYVKQSPHKRKVQAREVDEIRVAETKEERTYYLEKVQLLFKEKFDFAHDMDFIAYDPADQDEVHTYKYEDGPGPDLEHPQFDLTKNSKSPWNSAVLDILLQQLKDQCMKEQWPIQQPDAYIMKLLAECRQEGSSVEAVSPNHSPLKLVLLDHIIKLKTEGNKDDTDAWRWLQKLVETLGEHGMSSEESDVENEVEEVLR
ncbi:hypothetical protein BDN67DRAFT_986157 [Paxillus ammoniavirescens]|nr:hypothetical protein BDN67DRAFT_986157 [Paxillus ammoniavirescens]